MERVHQIYPYWSIDTPQATLHKNWYEPFNHLQWPRNANSGLPIWNFKNWMDLRHLPSLYGGALSWYLITRFGCPAGLICHESTQYNAKNRLHSFTTAYHRLSELFKIVDSHMSLWTSLDRESKKCHCQGLRSQSGEHALWRISLCTRWHQFQCRCGSQ